MRDGGTGWFVVLAASAIALGIGIHFVVTGGRGERGSIDLLPQKRSATLLADPVDPPERRARESSAGPGEPNVGDPLRLTPESRERLAVYKEMLKGKARAGEASDQERRILQALCRQLGDETCSN